ncbi:hypothetical protein O6H91_14G072100 [Diphasiastrum complanatum]|uniref:Uncharacterized protein n=2 Tax=Diphasiastrum complanatum TaxID=34168 RepID=A0ACC2BQN4_DIPCM|nr:hypothetical protein O6H91_14G072100 [Diphasiastrum complanatum]KAJ7532093.1 hypothetical protein O6H91_14G072100 [Diphasiastrum complanatum]
MAAAAAAVASEEEKGEQAMEQPDAECPAKALCKAAADGELARAEQLLKDGCDYSMPDELGVTPLMLAAQHGHASLVRLLLDAGAPWNALDRSGRCAGDYAMEAGHQAAFDMLLNAGIQAELILGAVERQNRLSGVPSNIAYLKSHVHYSENELLDNESKGVMMAWEKPLMEAHAKAICTRGGDILNVGFGMGLIDTAIQSYGPASHTIIEAHPEVHAHMLESGWGKKENVQVVFGRWQDLMPQLCQYDGKSLTLEAFVQAMCAGVN